MKTATYLNFNGQTEEAFEFYRSVFGGEFIGSITRMGDMPAMPGSENLPEAEKKLVMHVRLAITEDHSLMGTDILESMGMKLEHGNNVSIMLQPETRAELDRLYQKLSVGGRDLSPPKVEVWGDYFANLTDKFGIHWMLDVPA